MDELKKILLVIFLIAGFFGGVYYFNRQSGISPRDLALRNNTADNSRAVMKTNFGNIELEFFQKDAPQPVENFLKLAKSGFYNGTKFHRVIPDFMIQGGDPNSKDNNWADDGPGGPGYSFEDEINRHKLVKGVLAMANSGPDTNGSQFFIVTAEATPWLDGKHTVFGRVADGMDLVSKIENLFKNQNDHPLDDAVILKVEIVE